MPTTEFIEWRADEIAQVYLNKAGLDLLPDFGEKFDFIAFPKDTHRKQLAIEIKVWQRNLPPSMNMIENIASKPHYLATPFMIMFINVENEKGFFYISSNEYNSGVLRLNFNTLLNSINKLFRLMPDSGFI